MIANDEQVSLLKAFLVNDQATYREIEARLDRDPAKWKGYPAFVSVALLEALHRHFHEGFDDADIVKFVAAARQSLDPAGEVLDPVVCEGIVKAALGEGEVDQLDKGAVARSEMMLLAHAIEQEGLDVRGVESFLNDVQELIAESSDSK